MKTKVKSALFALCAAALICGCVPAPRQGDGRISLRVSWQKGRSIYRTPEEIATVTATLSRQELVLTLDLTVDQATGTASGALGNLYAGEWTVKVDAAMAEPDRIVIYTGQTEVIVVSGQTREVEMALLPAPGRLAIAMDIAPLLAAGEVVTEGKVYVYDADSTAATEDMTLDGTSLSALFELSPQTYDAKVAIPNVTNSVFTSEYFSFDILPGRTTSVSLAADGGLTVDITVTAEPDRVTGLTATPNGAAAILAWNQAARATGYRVYRTDGEGRFKALPAVVEGGDTITFTDENFSKAVPYDGKVRYAVAALAGTVEGLRSEPVDVPVI